MYRILVVIAAFCALTNGARLSWPAPRLDGRIVGGRPADIEDLPYQLSFRSYGSHICGASIIAENWVMTAAHCVEGRSPSGVSFRAGSSSKTSGGTIHQAVSIKMHPNYDSWNIDFDYALVEVAEPFPLGNPGVQKIELADVEPEGGSEATISGWGNTGSGSPDRLQVVQVPIVNRKTCQEKYSNYDITDRMICAGLDEGGKDSCQGDSGGPLVVNGKLCGIVSWGIGCAQPNYPGVYTNVANQRDWIKGIAGV